MIIITSQKGKIFLLEQKAATTFIQDCAVLGHFQMILKEWFLSKFYCGFISTENLVYYVEYKVELLEIIEVNGEPLS